MDSDGPAIGQRRLRKGAFIFYVASFAIITVCTVAGILMGYLGEALVGMPMVIILGYAILVDRRYIHVPPELIILVVLAFFLSLVGRYTTDDGSVIRYATDVLTGINLGLLGMILMYSIIRALPKDREGSRRMIAFVSICIALSSYTIVRLVQYYVFRDSFDMTMDELMAEEGFILIGAAIVALVSVIMRRDSVFDGIVNSFLEENSEMIGIEEADRLAIERIIEEGENEWVEYKSTVRTNLATGETDKRMEKAVLKTIVAFLNSEGGTLLIGVADDGSIIGADVASFDNSKDKMGLHLSNIISAQIGSSFLPYISTTMVDFDGKTVIRVKCDPCKRPVFLKEGKIEIFFVRRGPQTEELTGNTLLNYVNSRRKKMRGV